MVQLLTTKPRNRQLVSWLGLVTEVGNRKFTFGFLAKDRVGVVMGERIVFFTTLIKIICSATEF